MSDSPASSADLEQHKQSDSSDVVSVTDVIELMRAHRVRFASLAVAIVIAVTTVGYLATSTEPYYETEALVIATELEIRVDSLPRTAVAIFNGGTVAARAVELAGTDLDPDDLIPWIVEAQPLENTGVIEIDARHPDPELAAAYANAAGRALAEELNLIGPGLGTFTLQIPAPVPTTPRQQSVLPIVAISLVAAAALVIGVAALIAVFSPSTSAATTSPTAPTPAGRKGAATVTPSAAESPAAAPQPSPAMARKPSENNAPPSSDGKRSDKKSRSDKAPGTTAKQPGEDDLDELDLTEIEPLVHHLDRIPRPAPIHPLASSSEQANALMESISGVGPVFGARLAALGITKVSELASADPKWVADAVEVRREVVVDWIRQAMGLHSHLHSGDTEDTGEAEDA